MKLTLVMDPETFAIAEYMWKVRRDPAKHPGSCLVYKEEAPVGRLAVEIPVPHRSGTNWPLRLNRDTKLNGSDPHVPIFYAA